MSMEILVAIMFPWGSVVIAVFLFWLAHKDFK